MCLIDVDYYEDLEREKLRLLSDPVEIARRKSIPNSKRFGESERQQQSSKLISIARFDYGTGQRDDSVCEVLERIAVGETSILDPRVDPIGSAINQVRRMNAAYLQRCISKLYQLGRKLEDACCTLSESVKYLLTDLKLRTGYDIECNTIDRIELGSILECTVHLCNSKLYDHRLIGKYLQFECFKDDGERLFDSLKREGGISIDWSNRTTSQYVADYLVSLIIGKNPIDEMDATYAQLCKDVKVATPAWRRVRSLITRDPMDERNRALLLLQSAASRKLSRIDHSPQVKWLATMLGSMVAPSKFPFDPSLHDSITYHHRRKVIVQLLGGIVMKNTPLCKNLSSLIIEYLYDDGGGDDHRVGEEIVFE